MRTTIGNNMVMDCATFLAIETSPEAPHYPVVCAWSLADGSIKTSLVLPADGWPGELCYSDHLEREIILSQGHSVKDVMLEMNDDLDGQWVLCHADFTPANSFQQIADAIDIHPAFEWSDRAADLAELLSDYWREDLQDLSFELGLDLTQAEDQVRTMQICWARTNNLMEQAW
ncbi:MAG: hypothetical protein QF872_03205 [Gammaproteobacteria bacterium]|nr:hypothetical protein [Gammaproteobacteria bacterium]